MTELKAKHPEVTKMCKKEWRKHYRSLETEEAKKEARVERAKQTAEKERIISEYQLQQKQDKRKQASSNIAVKYADGEQANKGWMRSNNMPFCLHRCLLIARSWHVDLCKRQTLTRATHTSAHLSCTPVASAWPRVWLPPSTV